MAKEWIETPQGWGFWLESSVNLGGEIVPLDQMAPARRAEVMTQIEVNALNAAAGGRGVYSAEAKGHKRLSK